MKFDLYETVTNSIIASLENGVRPWQKPWSASASSGALPLRWNGKPYRGINTVLLWAASRSNPYWMTYKQAQTLGGNVRKGEKATMVVYFSMLEDKRAKAGEHKMIPLLRYYNVFNAEQIDDLPERYHAKAEPTDVTVQHIEHVEAFFKATGADIRYGGDQAFYVPSQDFIKIPKAEAFKDMESYYATLGHETVHWTGHKSRCDRQLSNFGTEAYAAEELVAEIGSAFLCAFLGLTNEVREDHAQYVASWLKVLKNDKRFVIRAASLAQKAIDFLTDEAGEEEEAEEIAQAA